MENLHVDVEQAHLESLAMAPKAALAEIIWNSIDADATTITCTVNPDVLGGVESFIVEDDGAGIAPDGLKQTFGALGYSWKRMQTLSDGGRFIHGKRGKGRWAGYAVLRLRPRRLSLQQRMARAGHPAPVHRRPGETARRRVSSARRLPQPARRR